MIKSMMSVGLGLGLALVPSASTLGLMQDEGWEAWRNGDIHRAEKAALEKADTDEGRHLLVNCAYVTGRYEKAIALSKEMDPDYIREKSTLQLHIGLSYIFLERYEEAVKFGEESKMSSEWVEHFKGRAELPFKIHLDKTVKIPMDTSNWMNPFFPTWKAEVNGTEWTVNVDTGGAYLVMSPGTMEELGIKRYGRMGICKQFKLGPVVMENVPVQVVPRIEGQNLVIFGTNIFQNVLGTLDYPNNRLILSPQGNEKERRKHLDMLPKKRSDVSFILAGDHMMIAKGSVGEHKNLNFFVDSGLVYLRPEDQGGRRQAAAMVPASNLKKWFAGVQERFFQSELSIGFSKDLEQKGLWLLRTGGGHEFSGIQSDLLISHAFLKNYAWTIDFENFRYLFSMRE